jgi:hypothetical protein
MMTYQLELQNAYEQGQMESFKRDASELDRINDALSIGLYVLVAKVQRHCPFTDATLRGLHPLMVSTHTTRKEASTALINAYDDEANLVILPRLA